MPSITRIIQDTVWIARKTMLALLVCFASYMASLYAVYIVAGERFADSFMLLILFAKAAR